ncbi:MAG: hypothetical protein Kow0092_05810 [Deferrisomatales bacterium]
MTTARPGEGLRLGAPSMVFGPDPLENVRRLAGTVDHVEVVLFHSDGLHNLPGPAEARALGEALRAHGMSASVHLPTTLELASPDPARREAFLALARRACACTAPLEPEHYVLHVPALPPTLVAVPGRYLRPGGPFDWPEWHRRARRSLELLAEGVGRHRLLVENINYSPCFLEPLLDRGFGLCLDLGHLLLGDEDVPAHLERYLDRAGELHLHGVEGYTDHLSLARLPPERVGRWVAHLRARRYRRPVTLEVFCPEDLAESAALFDGAG